VTFSYARINSPISFTWSFGATTSAQDLTVTQIPSGGSVKVICHGGGCPFAVRSFTPKNGTVALAPTLKHSHFHPGATLQLQITATNDVGKVATFKMRSRSAPVLSRSCLPPGARNPTACA
jgi:hypothetical protein